MSPVTAADVTRLARAYPLALTSAPQPFYHAGSRLHLYEEASKREIFSPSRSAQSKWVWGGESSSPALPPEGTLAMASRALTIGHSGKLVCGDLLFFALRQRKRVGVGLKVPSARATGGNLAWPLLKSSMEEIPPLMKLRGMLFYSIELTFGVIRALDTSFILTITPLARCDDG